MYELETLVVPEELGAWLGERGFGISGAYFSLIDELCHYWETVIGSPLGDFIAENKKELIEVIIGSRGYRVEEEQKYYVLNASGSAILRRNTDKEYNSTIAYAESGRLMKHIVAHEEERLYQFTEKEIKEYDERYWNFAVEVAE